MYIFVCMQCLAPGPMWVVNKVCIKIMREAHQSVCKATAVQHYEFNYKNMRYNIYTGM